MRIAEYGALLMVMVLAISPTHSEEKVVDTAAGQEMKKLEGSWQSISSECDGITIGDVDWRITFKGDRMISNDGVDCVFTVDAAKSPRRLQFTQRGARQIHCIYRIEGNDLKMAMCEAVDGWPTEFATRKDDEVLVVIFKKQRK